MENSFDIKKLSESTVKEIQELIGTDLIYLVAFGKDGTSVPLTTDSVKAEQRTVTPETPIKTQAISSIESASFVRYVGSCCWVYQYQNSVYVFCIDNC
jgi:hypothetical protein